MDCFPDLFPKRRHMGRKCSRRL